MSENEKDYSEEETPIVNPAPLQDGDKEGISEQEAADSKTSSDANNKLSGSVETIPVKKTNWSLQDKISFGGLVANIALVIFTLFALKYSRDSIELTREA